MWRYKNILPNFFLINSIEDEDVLVYYPSLYSIHCRVRLANKLGVGLAVVKLGEGLEYFYDVL